MRRLFSWYCLLFFLSGCSRPTVAEQARMLGERAFTRQAWAAASQIERGEMLASFLTRHPANGLSAGQVRQLLGMPTGYADYDEDPAYVIGPPTVQSRYAKGYLLIFVTDRQAGRVVEIRLEPEVNR